MVTGKAAGLPKAAHLAPSARLASLRMSGNAVLDGPMGNLPSHWLSTSLSSLLCFIPAPGGSRQRCDSCGMVPTNSFVNHSPMEMSGVAGKWELVKSQENTKALKTESFSSYRQGDQDPEKGETCPQLRNEWLTSLDSWDYCYPKRY